MEGFCFIPLRPAKRDEGGFRPYVLRALKSTTAALRPIRYTQGRPEEFEWRQSQDGSYFDRLSTNTGRSRMCSKDGERSRTVKPLGSMRVTMELVL